MAHPAVRRSDQATLHKNHSIMEGVVSGIAATATASACPTSAAKPSSSLATRAIRWSTRLRSAWFASDQIFYAQGRGRRQSRHLCRREDRPRRHPRRDHGQRRVQRRLGSQAPQRAGRRPVHGEAAARSLPRSHADRRHRRHSGHGRGRADLLHLRDGRARRRGPGDRTRPRAAARNRHDALRDHAQRDAGAHAAGRRKRPRRRSASRLRQVGTRRGHDRARSRPSHACASRSRRGRRRHSQPGAHRRRAALPPAAGTWEPPVPREVPDQHRSSARRATSPPI